MTNHDFACETCGHEAEVFATLADGPPEQVACQCGGVMRKHWGPVQFICVVDPDEIPSECQTADVGGGIGADGSLLPTTHAQVLGPSRERARKREKRYQSYIEERRSIFREHGQKGGQMTHQVPIELYHGKIKQTGDKDYWRDESNLKRHTSCKVS